MRCLASKFVSYPLRRAGDWREHGEIDGQMQKAIGLTTENNIRWMAIYYKLKQYEDAEENGSLVRLPCKVGTKLYYISGKFILEFEVCSFRIDETGAWLIYAKHYSEEAKRTFIRNFEADEIGKTVFLTQKEAEAKLKEMEGV